jgi:prepilin peptidase CpaA
MDALPQQLIFAGGSLACAAIGSVHDVRERRIPNRVTGPAVLTALALHAFAGGWSGLAGSALAGFIAGGIFLVFFLAGGMGAGDVKLMTAVACFIGLGSLQTVLLSTIAAGALLALAVGVRNGCLRETLRNVGTLLQHHRERGLRPHPALNLTNAHTLRLPFALPIAAGCLFTLCTLAWEARP